MSEDLPFNEMPAMERFAFLWPNLVDLLKEMGVPFVMTAQLEPEEKENWPLAYHLVPGMNPRIMFSAVLGREGVEGLKSLFQGAGNDFAMEKLDYTKEDALKEVARLEATDVHMVQIKMPTFVDTMREIEEGGDEEGGEEP